MFIVRRGGVFISGISVCFTSAPLLTCEATENFLVSLVMYVRRLSKPRISLVLRRQTTFFRPNIKERKRSGYARLGSAQNIHTILITHA